MTAPGGKPPEEGLPSPWWMRGMYFDPNPIVSGVGTAAIAATLAGSLIAYWAIDDVPPPTPLLPVAGDNANDDGSYDRLFTSKNNAAEGKPRVSIGNAQAADQWFISVWATFEGVPGAAATIQIMGVNEPMTFHAATADSSAYWSFVKRCDDLDPDTPNDTPPYAVDDRLAEVPVDVTLTSSTGERFLAEGLIDARSSRNCGPNEFRFG